MRLSIQRMGRNLTIDEQFDSCMNRQLNKLTIEWIANERMAAPVGGDTKLGGEDGGSLGVWESGRQCTGSTTGGTERECNVPTSDTK